MLLTTLRRAHFIVTLALAILLVSPVIRGGNDTVMIITQPRRPAELLAASFGQWQAISDARVYSPDQIEQLVGEEAIIYKEYELRNLAIREYADGSGKRLQVEIYQMSYPSRAYGIYSFRRTPRLSLGAFGPRGDIVKGAINFWQGPYYVRVIDNMAADASGAASSNQISALAQAISDKIGPVKSEQPPLLGHLPETGRVDKTERYFIGPRALSRYYNYGANEQFGFAKAVEAVAADYRQGGREVKLAIVEYHTPQLASEAHKRVQAYNESLPESKRNQLILKREGNYLVQALGFTNREAAQKLVNAVKYTYTIKWLKDPPPKRFDYARYRREAGKLLITIFSLIGLLILGAIIGGLVFGSSLFLRRRRRRELEGGFSDAGGMLRLNLDNLLPSGPDPSRLLEKGKDH